MGEAAELCKGSGFLRVSEDRRVYGGGVFVSTALFYSQASFISFKRVLALGILCMLCMMSLMQKK